MNMECLYDCGPSRIVIALLLAGAVAGFAAARWSRWSLLVSLPVLLVSLGYAGAETAFGDLGLALNVGVLGVPILGAIRGVRSRRGDRSAPA